MSLRIRVVGVIVRVKTIAELYPGSLVAYERDAPNTSSARDEYLTAIDFRSERDADLWAGG
jgi:hypothetical protein